MKTSSRLALAGLVFALGCSAGPSPEETATIQLALTQVPADVACVRITVAGSRTVVRSFPAMPGQSSSYTIGGLPLGPVTIRGDAFREMCQGVTDASVPGWVSEPIPATLAVERATMVTLVFQRNGRLVVIGDFQDDPDGGAPDTAPDTAPACPMSCDDGNPCTADVCDPNTGVCTHQLVPDGTACGMNAVCRSGMCAPACMPSPEVCNGIDDDCDGMVDEGLGTAICGIGICQRAVATCVGGSPQTCTPGVPGMETCNGLDDDCDGAADDGNPGGGGACNTGRLGVCSSGTTACTNGALVCNQNVQPTAETCNGLDDDCDGTVDEGNPGGGGVCNTGRPGVCAQGTVICANGVLVCNQTIQPGPETCNNLDDDCDGTVDEGCPPF